MLQQSCYFWWMGFLQQFHLVISYKKGIKNNFVDISKRPSINPSIVLQHGSLFHENYIELYVGDAYFKGVYETLIPVLK